MSAALLLATIAVVRGLEGHHAARRRLSGAARTKRVKTIAPAKSSSQAPSAVNLTPADAPGFKVRQATAPGAYDQFKAAIHDCLTSSGFGSGTTATDSPALVQGVGLTRKVIQSSVAVDTSPSAVAGDFAATSPTNLGGCLGLGFQSTSVVIGRGLPSTVAAVDATPLNVKVPGSEASLGWHVTFSMGDKGTPVPVYMDLLAYGVGRDELMLTTYSVMTPFQADVEQKLARLLVSRAAAAH